MRNYLSGFKRFFEDEINSLEPKEKATNKGGKPANYLDQLCGKWSEFGIDPQTLVGFPFQLSVDDINIGGQHFSFNQCTVYIDEDEFDPKLPYVNIKLASGEDSGQQRVFLLRKGREPVPYQGKLDEKSFPISIEQLANGISQGFLPAVQAQQQQAAPGGGIGG